MGRLVGSWTYALITPDGLAVDSLPWLVEKLRSSGLQPVAGRLIRLDSASMLRIYNPTGGDFPPHLPPRRAFDLWYALGPGCILVLHHDGPDANTAMLTVKGATIPRAASPDSIRYRGENGLMNLIHCPDSEAAAAEELALLVGPGHAQALRRLALAPDERVRRLTFDSLRDALPVDCGGTALSLPSIVNRIRMRLVQQLAIDGSSDESVLPILMQTASVLRDERNEVAKAVPAYEKAAVARTYDSRLHNDLLQVAELTRSSAIAGLLPEVSAFLAGPPRNNWPKTSAAMNASATYLSDKEAAALELSTYLAE